MKFFKRSNHTLWDKSPSTQREVFDQSVKDKGLSRGATDNVVELSSDARTGVSSQAYNIKVAGSYPRDFKAIIYFPKTPEKRLMFVKASSNVKTAQLKINEYLRESTGQETPQCTKVIIWVNGAIYHCTNVNNSLYFLPSDGVRFDNRNSFNDVIGNCPLLVKTDGSCRAELYALLIPSGAKVDQTHMKNGIAILTPGQIATMVKPNDLRYVADNDPRQVQRIYPETISDKNAHTYVNLHRTAEEDVMISASNEAFGSSSDSSDEDERHNAGRSSGYSQGTLYEFESEQYTEVTDDALLQALDDETTPTRLKESNARMKQSVDIPFDQIMPLTFEDADALVCPAKNDKGKGEEESALTQFGLQNHCHGEDDEAEDEGGEDSKDCEHNRRPPSKDNTEEMVANSSSLLPNLMASTVENIE